MALARIKSCSACAPTGGERLLAPRNTSPTLTPALATNCRFTLSLPLGARLLIVPALAQLGIQARTLHFALEAAQCAVEALVILDDYFQDYHSP